MCCVLLPQNSHGGQEREQNELAGEGDNGIVVALMAAEQGQVKEVHDQTGAKDNNVPAQLPVGLPEHEDERQNAEGEVKGAGEIDAGIDFTLATGKLERGIEREVAARRIGSEHQHQLAGYHPAERYARKQCQHGYLCGHGSNHENQQRNCQCNQITAVRTQQLFAAGNEEALVLQPACRHGYQYGYGSNDKRR